MLKRIFDFISSFFALIILSPMILIIATAIKVTSKGPVFYRQDRIGRNKKFFKIFKFRTMIKNADKVGCAITEYEDKRITTVGKFIRKWKLDEIPQLINVFLGQMSIVGPRPEITKYLLNYDSRIFLVKPGITDYASIIYKDEYKHFKTAKEKGFDLEEYYINQIIPKKVKLALFYIENKSFLLDIKIIFKTLSKIIK